MIPLGYLEMLHANHEDWLHEQSVSADELARHPLSHAEGACIAIAVWFACCTSRRMSWRGTR